MPLASRFPSPRWWCIKGNSIKQKHAPIRARVCSLRKRLLAAELSKGDENVDRRETHEAIDDARECRQVAKEGGNQVEVRDRNEAPVEATNDHENERDPIKSAQ